MESKMFIDDTPGITLAEMRAKARRLKQQQWCAGSDRDRLSAADDGIGRARIRRDLRTGRRRSRRSRVD